MRHDTLHQVLRNAERFMLKHKIMIEEAPLQTYTSAVLFSPTCLRRELVTTPLPAWMTTAPPHGMYGTMIDDWDPLRLQIDISELFDEEGFWPEYLYTVFSQDGSHIIIENAGGSDSRIQIAIWDLATGERVWFRRVQSHLERYYDRTQKQTQIQDIQSLSIRSNGVLAVSFNLTEMIGF